MIRISEWEFEGPYSSTSSLENKGGVYAILTRNGQGNHSLLDVGESSQVRDRVETHDRAHCWRLHSSGGGILYAALYTQGLQQEGRARIEQRLRQTYNPPCGER